MTNDAFALPHLPPVFVRELIELAISENLLARCLVLPTPRHAVSHQRLWDAPVALASVSHGFEEIVSSFMSKLFALRLDRKQIFEWSPLYKRFTSAFSAVHNFCRENKKDPMALKILAFVIKGGKQPVRVKVPQKIEAVMDVLRLTLAKALLAFTVAHLCYDELLGHCTLNELGDDTREAWLLETCIKRTCTKAIESYCSSAQGILRSALSPVLIQLLQKSIILKKLSSAFWLIEVYLDGNYDDPELLAERAESLNEQRDGETFLAAALREDKEEILHQLEEVQNVLHANLDLKPYLKVTLGPPPSALLAEILTQIQTPKYIKTWGKKVDDCMSGQALWVKTLDDLVRLLSIDPENPFAGGGEPDQPDDTSYMSGQPWSIGPLW